MDGMFVQVDSGCRGLELDLVLTNRKAESLGLRPYKGAGGEKVVLQGRAANRSPMPLVKMWPQVIMWVPLYKRGCGAVAAVRNSNLSVWAADLDTVDGSHRDASESGVAVVNKANLEEDRMCDEVVASSSSDVDEEVLAGNDEYDGQGYQALCSPICEDKHVALLGRSGLAKLGLRADFAQHMVYSVQLQGKVASMHNI